MKTFKFKRSLSAATAAIMTLSVMTGVVPGVVNKFAGNVEMSVSADGQTAQVNSSTDLLTAVNNANVTEIKLTGDITYDADSVSTLTRLYVNRSLTIDLDGHKLTFGRATTNNSECEELFGGNTLMGAFVVGSGGNLTIKNTSSSEATIDEQAWDTDKYVGYIFYSYGTGEVSINSNVKVSVNNVAIDAEGQSKVNINGATIESDNSTKEPFVFSCGNGSVVTVNDNSTLTAKNGDCITAQLGGKVIIQGGTITGAYTAQDQYSSSFNCGTVSATYGGSVEINGGTIENNTNASVGTAVAVGCFVHRDLSQSYSACRGSSVRIKGSKESPNLNIKGNVVAGSKVESAPANDCVIEIEEGNIDGNLNIKDDATAGTIILNGGTYTKQPSISAASETSKIIMLGGGKELTGTSGQYKVSAISDRPSHSVDYETVTEDGVTYYVYSDRAEAAEVDTSIKSAVIKSKVGGENVTAIGENAFNSCAVETVTIPETVTEIRNSAFWGCSALKKITIPKTVGYIGKDAFKRCSALEEISGYTGSAAETFAKSSNIKFVPLDGAVTTVSSTEVTVESTTTATTTTAVVTDKVKPGAPTNVKVDKNGNVTWDAADNAAYYKIVKVVKEKGVEKSYGVVVKNGTSGKISVPASDYRVYVAAFASNGSKTNSASVQVKVDKPLGYVNDPTVDAEGNVTFTAAENAVNYKIGKIVNGKTYYSKEFSGTTGTIKVPKTDYKIFVVAIDKNGKKTWGKIVDVELPLGTVTDPKVSSDGKVTWSAVRGAVSYKVGKKYTNSKGKAATGYTSLITDGKTEANIKLMKGENKVFVVAFDKDGNKTWGSKVTVVKE